MLSTRRTSTSRPMIRLNAESVLREGQSAEDTAGVVCAARVGRGNVHRVVECNGRGGHSLTGSN